MSFDVSITAETGRAFVPFLRQHLRAAHEALEAQRNAPRRGKPRPRRLPLRQMSLALVSDARMSDLHHRFMGIHSPTDVLTFPIDDNHSGQTVSGEVIVCLPEARRQAKQRRIPVRLELLLYSIHGMLHLLGYDDRNARDFHTMHHTEDDILTRLGFGPIFARATQHARERKRAPHLAPRHGGGLSRTRRLKSRPSGAGASARLRGGAR